MTETLVATGWVPIKKAAVFAPAGTVTLPNTAATAALLLERSMASPPMGAGPVRVTTPVVERRAPPVTLAGRSVTEVRVGGLTAAVTG